jgi:hypothetical protein
MVAAAFLLLAVGLNCGAVLRMQNRNLIITLDPLSVKDAPAVGGLALVETPRGVQLLSSVTRSAGGGMAETTISSTPIAQAGAPGSPVFVISQLLPPPPQWDAAPGPEGGAPFLFTYEMALGATYSVLFNDTKTEASVTAKYPFESFNAPRFVKKFQGNADEVITAIVDKKSAYLFRRKSDGSYEKQSKLCDCNDALIVRHKDGYLLFYKVNVPGAVRGTLIYPGTLRRVRLDKDFKPEGQSVEPLRGRVIYEFDADVSDERVVVFATSQQGTVLAEAASINEPLKTTAIKEEGSGEALTQPCILATRTHSHLAALENAQTGKARVLTQAAAAGASRP